MGLRGIKEINEATTGDTGAATQVTFLGLKQKQGSTNWGLGRIQKTIIL